MICPKCGHENTGNFCSNCGALLRRGDFPKLRSQTDLRSRKTEVDDSALMDSDTTDSATIDTADPSNSSHVSNPYGVRGRSRRREEPPERPEIPESRETRVRAPREEKEKPQPTKSGGGKSEKSGKPDKKNESKKNERAERRAEKASLKSEKAEKKEMQLRDARINKQLKEASERERLLSERLERLDRERSAREPLGRGRIERERAEQEPFDSQPHRDRRDVETEVHVREDGNSLGKAAVKGAVSAIVLSARVMQIFCGILMGYMVWTMAWSYWHHQEGLGLIQTAVEERNYGLVLYVGFAGISLFMGVIWCLWILSRKAAGGNVRLKTYDTGRGFLPFLICAAAVAAAGVALQYLPSVTAPYTSDFAEIIKGATAALEAVNDHRTTLLSCSVIGAAVSFVRKLLRV